MNAKQTMVAVSKYVLMFLDHIFVHVTMDII